MALLALSNFSVAVEEKTILQNINLSLKPGSLHVVMGPNGSGKSTLAHSIAGHPLYKNTGELIFNGEDISTLSPDDRARLGVFLAFQHPCSIPGVTVATCLFESYRAVCKDYISYKAFQDRMFEQMDRLGISRLIANRGLNEGFSGGERKRLEMLQALLLRPKLLILDEIDSGLDVDALRLVSKTLALFREENAKSSLLIITHYRHILNYLAPDHVHLMINGTIDQSGKADLALQVEQFGFENRGASRSIHKLRSHSL